MSQWLKQSTTVTIQLGPFLDSTDGVTAETGLTITQADIRLSKNGAAFAQATDANAATHDENGWYRKQIDTTDTGTLGRLIVAVNESGALPVWREFMVVPANEYDSLISGSDTLEVDSTLIEGADATDTIRDAVVDDATRIDASQLNTHSAITAVSIRTEIDNNSTQLAAIVADTNELQADDVPGLIGALNDPTAAAIVDEWETQSQADPTGFHVNVLEISGDGTAADNLELDYDGTGYAKANSTIGTTTTNTDVRGTDNAALAATALTDATWTDARAGYLDELAAANMPADLDAVLADTNELQSDDVPGLIGALNDPTAVAIRTEMDANSTQLAAIVADTNELQTDDVPGLIAALNDPTANAIADQVWEEAIADHSGTAGSTAEALDGASAPSAATVADAVWDEDIVAAHNGADTAGEILDNIDGHTAQTGDSYARLGAPAGASVSADIATVDGNVDAILLDTGTDGVQVVGLKAAALADLFDTDSGTDYASSVAGSVVKETADNAGGSSLTEAGIADAVWDELETGHVDAGKAGEQLWTEIDAIKAKTDLIAASSLTVQSVVKGSTITVYNYTTWIVTFSNSAVDLSGRDANGAYVSVKRDHRDSDDDAILRAQEGVGLLRLGGAAATAGNATLVINGAEDGFTLTVLEAVTGLSTSDDLVWDLKKIITGDVSEEVQGAWRIRGVVTRAVTA